MYFYFKRGCSFERVFCYSLIQKIRQINWKKILSDLLVWVFLITYAFRQGWDVVGQADSSEQAAKAQPDSACSPSYSFRSVQ